MGKVYRLICLIAIIARFSSCDQSCATNGEDDLVIAIVGGGLAGISAAIEAYEAGATVFLFEKERNLGGNSAKATSGINGADTYVQRSKGIDDSSELFNGDILKSGGGRSLLILTKVLSEESADAVEWLMGPKFNLSLTAISHCGGHSLPRTHRIPPLPDGRPVPVGFSTIKAVKSYLMTRSERIHVLTETKVTSLITGKNGNIEALIYKKSSEEAQDKENYMKVGAVVLTTGGYAYDRSPSSLLNKYAPEKVHLATTSGPQATGDGIKLVEGLGAKLVDMDQIQVHPTSLVDPNDPTNLTKFLGPETMRGEGGILVNKDGRRFVNELETRAKVTAAIFEHGSSYSSPSEELKEGGPVPTVAYLIMNSKVAEKFGIGMLGFYEKKGLVKRFVNGHEAAVYIGSEPEALEETFSLYSKVASNEVADEFGKRTFPVEKFSSDEEMFVAIVTPAIHYTMGGILINEHGQVIGSDGDVFGGLYAAGEVSGGVHGSNRLAGNSLLECVVMGRICGREAADEVVGRCVSGDSFEGQIAQEL